MKGARKELPRIQFLSVIGGYTFVLRLENERIYLL